MTDSKSVLVIGLEPSLIDFSDPFFAGAPPMDATKVLAGLKVAQENLRRQGFDVYMCLTDLGETAEAVVKNQLEQTRFACVLIGAGIRTMPSNFLLFEKLLNVAHEYAPQARLCFNTNPGDTAEAIRRWL